MPVNFIISQPATDSIHAAYRPIKFYVNASNTEGTGLPPVVYCDIYFDNTYYKTISKTQYIGVTGPQSQWEFDIQDAVQEYLKKSIANNGTAIITEIPSVVRVFCRFRSSGYNAVGQIVIEGTAPIQSTGSTPAVSGSGVQSNSFFGVNAALQHADNQDLAAHLSSFKEGDWDNAAYPLTHRPSPYHVCKDDSDSFPILSNTTPGKVVLHYRQNGVWMNSEAGFDCIPVDFEEPALPNGKPGVPYVFSFNVTGTPAFTLSNIIKPAWMTISVSGNSIEFTGTPPAEASDVTVQVQVNNCGGNKTLLDTIDIVDCIPVSFAGAISLPNAVIGVPYNYVIPLNGTPPFNIAGTLKPSWMTVTVVGNTIVLGGTPIRFSILQIVVISVTNCAGITISHFDSINTGAPTAAISVRMSTDSGDICSDNTNYGIVYTSNGTIATGLVAYTDTGRTIPLTGFYYILNAAVGAIFEIDPVTGMIGVPTGASC